MLSASPIRVFSPPSTASAQCPLQVPSRRPRHRPTLPRRAPRPLRHRPGPRPRRSHQHRGSQPPAACAPAEASHPGLLGIKDNTDEAYGRRQIVVQGTAICAPRRRTCSRTTPARSPSKHEAPELVRPGPTTESSPGRSSVAAAAPGGSSCPSTRRSRALTATTSSSMPSRGDSNGSCRAPPPRCGRRPSTASPAESRSSSARSSPSVRQPNAARAASSTMPGDRVDLLTTARRRASIRPVAQFLQRCRGVTPSPSARPRSRSRHRWRVGPMLPIGMSSAADTSS